MTAGTSVASMISAVESKGDRLARWAASLKWSDVDKAVRAKVKEHVLDTLGVMCAGLETPQAHAVQRAVRAWGGIEESTVLGRTWRVPAAGAAFLNAFHARVHTYDDNFEEGPTHPGSSVVSAALACAEAAGASGIDFLVAVLAGYEMTTRVSASVTPTHYDSGFHNVGTVNTFGAGAAAGRIFGFEPQAMVEALGLAGESAAGIRQYQIVGTMSDTAFDGARAAQSGVFAAQYRLAGLLGPEGILDGPLGFCRVFAPECDPDRLDRDLGVTYEFMKTSIKPYPSCRSTHGPIDALIGLRNAHAIESESVDEITIRTFEHSTHIADRPMELSSFAPMLSHQYCSAVALTAGRLTVADLSGSMLADPRIRELAGRVRVIHDPALDSQYPLAWPHYVAVRLKDGRSYEVVVEQPPGARTRPLTSTMIEDKFIGLATPVLGLARSRALIDAIASLHEVRNMREISPLLLPDGP